jgi:hypothetical protein
MQFQVWRGSTLVTRGHVEDLQDGEVAARVEYVQAATSTVDETMRVQFIPAILAVGGRLKGRTRVTHPGSAQRLRR